MSIHLLHKNTFRAGYIPQPHDLEVGQLGITIHTGEVALWTKDDAGNIVKLSGGGGGGSGDPVYNGMLTLVNADGSPAGSFTANQAGDTTISLPAGFSGDYDDLINKPDIGDGELTIKDAEGNVLGTFTANQLSGSVITLPPIPEVNDGKLTIKDSDGNELGVFTANQDGATEIVIPAAPDNSDPGCKPEQLERKPFDNAQANGVQAGEFYAVTDNGHPGETKVLVSEEFLGIEDGDSIWIECKEYTPDSYSKTDYPTSKYVQFYVPGAPDQFPPIGETLEVSTCDPECPESVPQMVFYGTKPPDEAPDGAIFTDEDSLKQFIHQGDGVWVEQTSCTGGGAAGPEEKPWVRIDDWRVVRNWWGTTSNSPDGFAADILLWDVPCNESKPYTLTQEWEWDEVGDGNWVAFDPATDANAHAPNYEDNWRWTYTYAPENAGSDTTGLDPSHPHPCAKVRCRVKNEWDDGTFEWSNWAEFWVGKAATPTYGTDHQPPSVC